MKPRFRQSMNWLHTWTGFIFGWLMYFIFVTGSAGYFENEIDRWMKPEMTTVNQAIDERQLLKSAEHHLNTLASDSPEWYIGFPVSRNPFIGISWLQPANSETNTPREWKKKNLNPIDGSTTDVRETGGGRTLYRLHYNLYYVPKVVGYILTSLAGMLMLISLITGVIIHKKIFIEFFTFRSKKGLRAWLDIHNIFSVLPLPFHLMITYSGLLLLMGITMSTVIDTTYGEGKKNHKQFYKEAHIDIKEQKLIKLPPDKLSLKTVFEDARNRFKNQKLSYIGLKERGTKDEHYDIWFDAFEGIKSVSSVEYRIKGKQVEIEVSRSKAGKAASVYEFFEHLHEGLFAGIYLRWLYFLSGLLGSGMIATGMILWILKRQKNADKQNKIKIVELIERVNVGVIVGVPIAIAVYFWSNRLIPINLVTRSEWEVHSLFISLIACICFCLIRAKRTIWKNMLWLAASVYMLLPVLNIFTTEHNLISSIQKSDSLMLGFDLSMLFFGGCFAIAGMTINRKAAKNITKNSLVLSKN
ncbi:MAG: PepSY domain-containing protein [Colwellia sp.]